MTIKFAKVLVATVALGALVLGTDPSMAKGGGGHGGGGHGGGGHGGGGHGGRGGHWGGGGHFSASHVRRGGAHVRGFAHGKSFAHGGLSHVGKLGAAGALGGHAAWNHWGNHWKTGWNGGWGGWGGWWGGSVFWPFFYGDLLAFALWPYGYYYPVWFDPFFVWDAIFWPGPYYAYGPPYYDVYGDYGYYGGHARARHIRARYVNRETTGSTVNGSELAQTCGGLAPGVTDLPIDSIQRSLQLTDDQLNSLNALKAASSQASDALKASCSSEIPMTPLGRLETVQKRLDGMVQAWGIMRTPLDNFYNSLNEEQRQRFAALAPVGSARTRRGPASSNDLAALCSRREESFTQLPVQRIEQVIKPTQQQQDVFDKLKAASTDAANQLQASCPAELPQAPIDRFDAVGKRLDAMTVAVKTVRPALADFYSSLTDEQKARFNTLGPPKTTSSRQG
jgi:LTXXQ motif family protein